MRAFREPILPGHAYRNGAGQVRMVLQVNPEFGKLTYEVLDPGPVGPRKTSLHVRGYVGTLLILSFQSWAVSEVPIPKKRKRKKA